MLIAENVGITEGQLITVEELLIVFENRTNANPCCYGELKF